MARQFKLTEENEAKYNDLSAKLNISVAQIGNDLLAAADEAIVRQILRAKFTIQTEDGPKEIEAETETEVNARYNRKESTWKIRL